MSPNVSDIMNFLTHCFKTGLGYSAINTIRSALSTFIYIDNITAGAHPLVVQLMKGIFASRPALSRNTVTWDTDVLLNYLKKLSPLNN